MTQAEITTRKVYLTNIDGSTAARLAAFYATINDAIVGLAEDYRLSREEACRLVARWLERNAPDDSDETSTAEAEDFVAMEGDGYELLKTVDGAYQGCVGVFKTDKAACRKLKLIETAKCAEPTILFV